MKHGRCLTADAAAAARCSGARCFVSRASSAAPLSASSMMMPVCAVATAACSGVQGALVHDGWLSHIASTPAPSSSAAETYPAPAVLSRVGLRRRLDGTSGTCLVWFCVLNGVEKCQRCLRDLRVAVPPTERRGGLRGLLALLLAFCVRWRLCIGDYAGDYDVVEIPRAYFVMCTSLLSWGWSSLASHRRRQQQNEQRTRHPDGARSTRGHA